MRKFNDAIFEPLELRTLMSGNGLTGVYYNNSDFTGVSQTRTDATVNFNWGAGAPSSAMGADTFAVRWTGKVETGAIFVEGRTLGTVTAETARLGTEPLFAIGDANGATAGGATRWSAPIVCGIPDPARRMPRPASRN